MSIEAMAWAFKQKITDAQTKLILLAVCDHADEDGFCWPSQERLAVKSACSVDTIQRRLRDLVSDGFLVVRRRARKTAMYRITLYETPMKPQHVRYQALAPTVAERDQMLKPHGHFDDTANEPHEAATGAVLTINTNRQTDSDSKEESESVTATDFFGTEERQPKQRKQKRVSMPENWEPDEKGVLFARDRGFTEQKIRELVMACRDYHLKHGTLIAGSVGLAATWRTWCNNEVRFSEERKARHGGKARGGQNWEDAVFAGVRAATVEMARDRERGREDATIPELGGPAADGRGTGHGGAADRRH